MLASLSLLLSSSVRLSGDLLDLRFDLLSRLFRFFSRLFSLRLECLCLSRFEHLFLFFRLSSLEELRPDDEDRDESESLSDSDESVSESEELSDSDE